MYPYVCLRACACVCICSLVYTLRLYNYICLRVYAGVRVCVYVFFSLWFLCLCGLVCVCICLCVFSDYMCGTCGFVCAFACARVCMSVCVCVLCWHVYSILLGEYKNHIWLDNVCFVSIFFFSRNKPYRFCFGYICASFIQKKKTLYVWFQLYTIVFFS